MVVNYGLKSVLLLLFLDLLGDQVAFLDGRVQEQRFNGLDRRDVSALRPMDFFVLDPTFWYVDPVLVEKKLVSLLVTLMRDLVYDATLEIRKEFQRFNAIRINA